MPHRRWLIAAVLPLVAAGMALTGAASATAAAGFTHYVSLGDSYAAGPLIPVQQGDPAGCLRSNHDYPADVAAALHIPDFVDVSCSGAVTADMTQPQSVGLQSNPPEFDALTPDTDLVTVTIGGNDIGFVNILVTCATLSFTNPFGNPCQRHYTAGGTDQLVAAINATAPKIAAVLAGIRQRAPHATVVVVGYLRILPPSGGCWPLMPVAAGDVPYLGGIEQQLNAMLGQQAAAAGDPFVNPGLATGHDVCEPPAAKWVEGVVPTAPAASVHPNAAGMAEVASLIEGSSAVAG